MCLGVRGLHLSRSSRASWGRSPGADLEAWVVTTRYENPNRRHSCWRLGVDWLLTHWRGQSSRQRAALTQKLGLDLRLLSQVPHD